jgi:hypothetical protein
MLKWIALAALAGAVLGAAGGCAKQPEGPAAKTALPALTQSQRELAGRLKGHVEMLGTTIGPRTALEFPAKLEQAAAYIEKEFRGMGFETTPVEYLCRGVKVRNIEVSIPGSAPGSEVVVIGAHYDSAHDSPAANDNGSGVASMLELARLAKGMKPGKTLRFVAFVNEEPPYFASNQMGSYVYAAHCRKRGDKVTAMLSLETMGYYSDARNSQKYPSPLDKQYPDTGNFIAFATRLEDQQLMERVLAKFREASPFPSEGGALPAKTEGVWFSDHWSFWEHGYPALMVTDTAMFRYPYYHTRQDTPDKVDYERLARVTEGLAAVIRDLVDAK